MPDWYPTCAVPDVFGNHCERLEDHEGLHFASAWWFDASGNSAYDGNIPADVAASPVMS